MRHLIVLVVLLATVSNANAEVLFSDDFEMGEFIVEKVLVFLEYPRGYGLVAMERFFFFAPGHRLKWIDMPRHSFEMKESVDDKRPQ